MFDFEGSSIFDLDDVWGRRIVPLDNESQMHLDREFLPMLQQGIAKEGEGSEIFQGKGVSLKKSLKRSSFSCEAIEDDGDCDSVVGLLDNILSDVNTFNSILQQHECKSCNRSDDEEVLHLIESHHLDDIKDTDYPSLNSIGKSTLLERVELICSNNNQGATPNPPTSTTTSSCVENMVVSCTGSSTLLPQDFEPSPYSVIVGKGRVAKNAIGNQRLKVLASSYLPKYASASERETKTEIVSTLVSTIHTACPIGGFIRLGKEDGRWYTVSESVAREKVGYTFRELLGDKYRSSSRAKAAMRSQERRRRSNLIRNQSNQGSIVFCS